MKTTCFVWTLPLLLPVGASAADEPGGLAETVPHEAHGLWYGVYNNPRVDDIDFGSDSPSVGSTLSNRNFGPSGPIFYVLALAVRGDEIVGTITSGRGVKYEDPQEPMKRVLGLPVEQPKPPRGRLVDGHVDGAEVSVATRTPSGATAGMVVTGKVDGDRMRARIQLPQGETRIVRLQRCMFDEVEFEIGAAAGSGSGSESRSESGSEDTSEGTSCSIDAVWQHLSEERGTPVNPARGRPPRTNR
jgi:hypothetical protein